MSAFVTEVVIRYKQENNKISGERAISKVGVWVNCVPAGACPSTAGLKLSVDDGQNNRMESAEQLQ